jgi:hypothetical protein
MGMCHMQAKFSLILILKEVTHSQMFHIKVEIVKQGNTTERMA